MKKTIIKKLQQQPPPPLKKKTQNNHAFLYVEIHVWWILILFWKVLWVTRYCDWLLKYILWNWTVLRQTNSLTLHTTAKEVEASLDVHKKLRETKEYFVFNLGLINSKYSAANVYISYQNQIKEINRCPIPKILFILLVLRNSPSERYWI